MSQNLYQLLPMKQDLMGWTLRLRNDPETRAMSFDQGVVNPLQHAAWFKNRMQLAPLNWWYLRDGDQAVGHGRLDLRVLPDAGELVYEISVTVAPGFRGRGFGWQLIKAVASLGRSERDVLALIKEENAASLSAFRHAGFEEYIDVVWSPPPGVKALVASKS